MMRDASMPSRLRLSLLSAVAVASVASAAGLAPPVLDFDDTSWHKYIRAPPSRLVSPVRILPEYTRGNVSNADKLVTGRGVTTLTRFSPDADIPTVVVDFGQ